MATVTLGNGLVEGFLKPVPQGRIKLIIKQIQSDAK
jgi:hypothetical protein